MRLPSWKPHCFKLIVVAEPRNLEIGFNEEIWYACVLMYTHVCDIKDSLVLILLEVLEYFDRRNYNCLTSFSFDMTLNIIKLVSDTRNFLTTDEDEQLDKILKLLD